MAVINTSSLSFEQIKSDIISYLGNNVNTNPNKWLDTFSSGAGMTIAELIAGLASYVAFAALNSRKEAFLDTAKQKSSIYSMANIRGLTINRPEAPKLIIKFRDPIANIPSVIGSINGADLVALRKHVGDGSGVVYENVYDCYLGRLEESGDIEIKDPDDFFTLSISPDQVDGERPWFISNDVENITVQVTRDGKTYTMKLSPNSEDLMRDEDKDPEWADALVRTTVDGINLVFGGASDTMYKESSTENMNSPVKILYQDKFVAIAGSDSISMGLIYTEDGEVWRKSNVDVGLFSNVVKFDGRYYATSPNVGAIYATTDLNNWTVVETGNEGIADTEQVFYDYRSLTLANLPLVNDGAPGDILLSCKIFTGADNKGNPGITYLTPGAPEWVVAGAYVVNASSNANTLYAWSKLGRLKSPYMIASSGRVAIALCQDTFWTTYEVDNGSGNKDVQSYNTYFSLFYSSNGKTWMRLNLPEVFDCDRQYFREWFDTKIFFAKDRFFLCRQGCGIFEFVPNRLSYATPELGTTGTPTNAAEVLESMRSIKFTLTCGGEGSVTTPSNKAGNERLSAGRDPFNRGYRLSDDTIEKVQPSNKFGYGTTEEVIYDQESDVYVAVGDYGAMYKNASGVDTEWKFVKIEESEEFNDPVTAVREILVANCSSPGISEPAEYMFGTALFNPNGALGSTNEIYTNGDYKETKRTDTDFYIEADYISVPSKTDLIYFSTPKPNGVVNIGDTVYFNIWAYMSGSMPSLNEMLLSEVIIHIGSTPDLPNGNVIYDQVTERPKVLEAWLYEGDTIINEALTTPLAKFTNEIIVQTPVYNNNTNLYDIVSSVEGQYWNAQNPWCTFKPKTDSDIYNLSAGTGNIKQNKAYKFVFFYRNSDGTVARARRNLAFVQTNITIPSEIENSGTNYVARYGIDFSESTEADIRLVTYIADENKSVSYGKSYESLQYSDLREYPLRPIAISEPAKFVKESNVQDLLDSGDIPDTATVGDVVFKFENGKAVVSKSTSMIISARLFKKDHVITDWDLGFEYAEAPSILSKCYQVGQSDNGFVNSGGINRALIINAGSNGASRGWEVQGLIPQVKIRGRLLCRRNQKFDFASYVEDADSVIDISDFAQGENFDERRTDAIFLGGNDTQYVYVTNEIERGIHKYVRSIDTQYSGVARVHNDLVFSTNEGVFFETGTGSYTRSELVYFGDPKTLGFPLKDGDTVTVSFLSSQGRTGFSSVTPDSITLDIDNEVISQVVSYVDGGIEETLDKIRAMTPGYHSSYRRLISTNDFIVHTLAARTDIFSANAYKCPYECCTAVVPYLRGYRDVDGFIFQTGANSVDNDELNKYFTEKLKPYRIIGTQARWEPAQPTAVDFNVVITLVRGADEDWVRKEIRAIVLKKLYSIAGYFSIGEFSDEISHINGVVGVHFLKPNDDFKCSVDEFLFTSQEILDNGIKFKYDAKDLISDDDAGYGYIGPVVHLRSEEYRFTFSSGEYDPDSEELLESDLPLYSSEAYTPQQIGVTLRELDANDNLIEDRIFTITPAVYGESSEDSQVVPTCELGAKFVQIGNKVYLRFYTFGTNAKIGRYQYSATFIAVNTDGTVKNSVAEKLIIDII